MTLFRSGRPARSLRTFTTRSIAGLSVVPLLLATSACGSSGDDSADSATDVTPEVTASAATTGTGSPGDEAADDSSDDRGAAALTITTDTGESWTLEQTKCRYQPDNEGAFVEVWGAEAVSPSGVEFSVIAATPPDPSSDEGIGVDGILIDDENDILYVVIEGEAVSDGTTMTMTLGMHSSPLRVVGDPIDLTATVTCEL